MYGETDIDTISKESRLLNSKINHEEWLDPWADRRRCTYKSGADENKLEITNFGYRVILVLLIKDRAQIKLLLGYFRDIMQFGFWNLQLLHFGLFNRKPELCGPVLVLHIDWSLQGRGMSVSNSDRRQKRGIW